MPGTNLGRGSYEMAGLRIRNDDCPTPSKVGYSDKREAKKSLALLRTRHATNRKPEYKLAVYLCVCGLYHLGNRRRGQRRDGTFVLE